MAGNVIGLDRRDESDDRREGGADPDGAEDPAGVLGVSEKRGTPASETAGGSPGPPAAMTDMQQ